jgi:hypothetical protein
VFYQEYDDREPEDVTVNDTDRLAGRFNTHSQPSHLASRLRHGTKDEARLQGCRGRDGRPDWSLTLEYLLVGFFDGGGAPQDHDPVQSVSPIFRSTRLTFQLSAT